MIKTSAMLIRDPDKLARANSMITRLFIFIIFPGVRHPGRRRCTGNATSQGEAYAFLCSFNAIVSVKLAASSI
ncbi:MAG: hypothetical protein ACYC9H_06585 [Sulfuricaulis sp.]